VQRSQPVEREVGPWRFDGVEGRRVLTPHFAIYSTLADTPLEEALPDYLEAAYREYAALVPPKAGKAERLETYVFDQRSQWERFTARRFPGRFHVYRQITAGGYSEGTVCAVYYIRRPYTLSVLAHEGMHQYLAQNSDVRLPAWLNEGLATYCESFELPGGAVRFTPKRNTFRTNALREALQAGSVLRLREMLATDAGAVIVQGQSVKTRTYYAQAWALVMYLRHGAMGRYAGGFNRLMRDLATGEAPTMAQAAKIRAQEPAATSFGEAVFRAYITEDLDLFEEEFEGYLYGLAGFKR
jgi:hypothetical protein